MNKRKERIKQFKNNFKTIQKQFQNNLKNFIKMVYFFPHGFQDGCGQMSRRPGGRQPPRILLPPAQGLEPDCPPSDVRHESTELARDDVSVA